MVTLPFKCGVCVVKVCLCVVFVPCFVVVRFLCCYYVVFVRLLLHCRSSAVVVVPLKYRLCDVVVMFLHRFCEAFVRFLRGFCMVFVTLPFKYVFLWNAGTLCLPIVFEGFSSIMMDHNHP